ncbi:neuronal PAS domain-containing protein 3-like isoform X2 [Petromyzon marinus]|uniref:neuronal PAS domain-containing protein 3-like isoform X2 n=1 Tax=Petromyzon marinus TaxID=7757 RepID=UPI003F6FD641
MHRLFSDYAEAAVASGTAAGVLAGDGSALAAGSLPPLNGSFGMGFAPFPDRLQMVRKEKSRDAARSRRGKENFEFYELAKLLPLPGAITSQLDKASIVRLTISYLKIRNFAAHGDPPWNLRSEGPPPNTSVKAIGVQRRRSPSALAQEVFEQHLGSHVLQALDGFVFALTQDGRFLYISETVSIYLGLSQVEMTGSSVFEYVHPGDHAELAEHLGMRLPPCRGAQPPAGGHAAGDGSSPTSSGPETPDTVEPVAPTMITAEQPRERSFFLRMKSTLTKRGLHVKASGFKVIHVTGRLRVRLPLSHALPPSPTPLLGLVALAHALPPPALSEVRVDCHMFVTRLDLDLKIVYCENRVSEFMDMSPGELLGRSCYHFVHAEDVEAIRHCHVDLINKGQCVTQYYRWMQRHGGYVWIQSLATVSINVKNAGGDKNIVWVNYLLSNHERGDCPMDLQQLPRRGEADGVTGSSHRATPGVVTAGERHRDEAENLHTDKNHASPGGGGGGGAGARRRRSHAAAVPAQGNDGRPTCAPARHNGRDRVHGEAAGGGRPAAPASGRAARGSGDSSEGAGDSDPESAPAAVAAPPPVPAPLPSVKVEAGRDTLGPARVPSQRPAEADGDDGDDVDDDDERDSDGDARSTVSSGRCRRPGRRDHGARRAAPGRTRPPEDAPACKAIKTESSEPLNFDNDSSIWHFPPNREISRNESPFSMTARGAGAGDKASADSPFPVSPGAGSTRSLTPVQSEPALSSPRDANGGGGGSGGAGAAKPGAHPVPGLASFVYSAGEVEMLQRLQQHGNLVLPLAHGVAGPSAAHHHPHRPHHHPHHPHHHPHHPHHHPHHPPRIYTTGTIRYAPADPSFTAQGGLLPANLAAGFGLDPKTSMEMLYHHVQRLGAAPASFSAPGAAAGLAQLPGGAGVFSTPEGFFTTLPFHVYGNGVHAAPLPPLPQPAAERKEN